MRFCNLQQKKKEDLLDLDLQLEEKEEYQPYAWNKKKYVPVGRPQPSLNLCKECLFTLSKFLNPLIFDEHWTKIYKRKSPCHI